jgi:short-subunit dehydrogenase involved in D-alanine esterification of teichoic acids
VAFLKASAADLSVLINNAGSQRLTDLVHPESIASCLL